MKSSSEKINIRVRGIYATALTKLLLDSGFEIVDVSTQIQDRFRIEDKREIPADVTVKSDEKDLCRLMVIGFPKQVDAVVRTIRESIPHCVYYEAYPNLYSVIKIENFEKSDKKFFAILPDGRKAKIITSSEPETPLIATVIRAAVSDDEIPAISPGLRLVGKYAIVSIGQRPKITISEHVRNFERKSTLIMLATKYFNEGLGIHWRSNSANAPLDELSKELEILSKRIREIKIKAENGPPGIYSEGEKIAFVEFSFESKIVLDELRRKVVPTVKYHHMIKSTSPSLSEFVDFAEKIAEKNYEVAGKEILKMIIEKLKRKLVRIDHVKLDGKIARLTPGKLISVDETNERLQLTIKREIKGEGIYDGLKIPRKPGDYDLMIVQTERWFIIHRYFSAKGELKGEYYNINTPPEITENGIRYIDLYIDVIRRPNGEIEIIDEDQLKRAYESGRITRQTYERALTIASELLEGKID